MSTVLTIEDIEVQVELPPLPPIADPDLRQAAVTHIGTSSPVSERFPHYEMLAIYGRRARFSCRHVFAPQQARDDYWYRHIAVSNKTFAGLSAQYGLGDNLIANATQSRLLRTQPRILADLFEANVGATYFDFLVANTPGGYVELGPDVAAIKALHEKYLGKASTLPTLPPIENRTTGMATDFVYFWFAPLFAQILDAIPAGQDATVDISSATMELNEYVQQQCGKQPEEHEKRLRPDTGDWSVICQVTLDGKGYETTASGSKKQTARNAAANKMLPTRCCH